MLNIKLILLLLVILPTVLMKTDKVNYCRKGLCAPGKKHIACKNSGKFQSDCGKDVRIIKMTSMFRDTILHEHNKYRNQIAKGFKKFKPAIRMATMSWDNELAKLAELNVKQCRIKHDQCRNTEKFHYAGQNLATTRWYGFEKSVTDVIKQQIEAWFNEYKDCPVSYINNFPKERKGKPIGHFTAMVQEKNTHVGCAMLKHKKSNGFTEQLMVCNYARTNLINKPVYRIGSAASKCETKTNPKYKYLCSKEEKYDVNVA